MATLGNYNPIRAGLILLGLLALLGMSALASGCGMGGDSSATGDFAPGDDTPPLLNAQAALARHNVDEAQAIYNQIIADNTRPPGQAYAGKAITDLLLLPGSSAVTSILVEQLHATSGIDANDTIYADEGYLYWLARGVPWSDNDTYSGIRTLIADELPWSQERLSATRAFFEGLSAPLNLATDDLVLLADTMAGIENDIARAIADPNFDTIYIPGLTFHSERLDLFLGRAELHILSGMLSASRAAIYFMTAYEYDFTLDELLGSQAAQRLEPREGWTTEDYAVAFLDGRFLRVVRDPTRLEEARMALDASLESAIMAIDAGMNAPGQTSIHWQNGEAAYAEILVEFLQALRASLHEPTLLPGSSPQTTLDLSSFFDAGRVLDAQTAWFERIPSTPVTVGSEPLVGEDGSWEVTAQAQQAFAIDGVFNPPFDPEDADLTLAVVDDERAGDFFEALLGPLRDDAGETY